MPSEVKCWCLESHTIICSLLSPGEVYARSCKQLSIPLGICAPGTHYCWVARGDVDSKACPRLSGTGAGNRTHDLSLTGPTPLPLGHTLHQQSREVHPGPTRSVLKQVTDDQGLMSQYYSLKAQSVTIMMSNQFVFFFTSWWVEIISIEESDGY
jgi:hypothetical protein